MFTQTSKSEYLICNPLLGTALEVVCYFANFVFQDTHAAIIEHHAFVGHIEISLFWFKLKHVFSPVSLSMKNLRLSKFLIGLSKNKLHLSS